MLHLIQSMGIMVFPQTALVLTVSILILVNLVRVIRRGAGLPRIRLRQSIDAILFWGCLAAVLGFLGTSLGLAGQADAIFAAHAVNPKMVVAGFAEAVSTTAYGLFVLTLALFSWFGLRAAADRWAKDVLVEERRPAAQIEVHDLANAYRRLVLWFGVQLVLDIVTVPNAALEGPVHTALSLLVLAGGLATFVALVVYGYRTAEALGSTVPWLWAVGMFVPGVNLLTLLALSFKATRACQDHGIAVGLFGPQV